MSILGTVIHYNDNGREARLNQEGSHILKWKNAEEKNGFRNNCIISIGISAIGIILAVLA